MVTPTDRKRRRRRALSALTIVVAVTVPGAEGAGASAAPPAAGVSAYIVGGAPIGVGQYPSLAAIMLADASIPPRQRLVCTATVVTPRWILTAGHCAQAALFDESLVVQTGSRDLGRGTASTQTVALNRAVVHKTYWDRGVGYDVALFHTRSHIFAPVSRLAAEVDLPLTVHGKPTTAVGWGLTQRLGIAQPPAPRALPPRRARAVDIPIVDDTTCANRYADFAPGYFVPASDLCAGAPGKNVCYGDSGGPLYARDPLGALVQVGITSRGAGCATAKYPGIFTEVRRLHAWIQRWTTRQCTTKVEIPGVPDFPTGPLYAC